MSKNSLFNAVRERNTKMAWNKSPNNRNERNKKLVSNNSLRLFNQYVHSESIYNLLSNIILATDSYKLTHWTMYKTLGITHVYSYLEARTGADFDHTVWFGLKYFLDKLSGVKITDKLVKQSKAFVDANVGSSYFNEEMWMKIATHYNGKLPVIIRAAPEGSVIPVGNALLTIENEDPDCVGLVNHLESLLLQVWYPCTVATISKAVKDAINEYKIKTGEYDRAIVVDENGNPILNNNGKPILTNPMWTEHQLLDFGYRGASSAETAALGGLAHLTNFLGSDTIAASLLGAHCYDMPLSATYSVAATEHSIMTSLGKESEFKLLYALIKDHKDNRSGVLSLVMDSYNIFQAINRICNDDGFIALMKSIPFDAERRIPGKVVFRPDSGSPAEVIPILLGIIENSKCGKDITSYEYERNQYKILPPYLGILWGDGMNPTTVRELLEDITTGFPKEKNPKNKYITARTNSKATINTRNGSNRITYPRTTSRWAVRNFLFGMGGGLLQKVTRDTQNFAFKCSANKTTLDKTANGESGLGLFNNMELSNSRPNNNRTKNNNNTRNIHSKEGDWVAVIKNPITGSSKTSKKGLLKLVKEGGKYKTLESIKNKDTFGKINDANNLLQVVFKNGELVGPYKRINFNDIKAKIVSEDISIKPIVDKKISPLNQRLNLNNVENNLTSGERF